MWDAFSFTNSLSFSISLTQKQLAIEFDLFFYIENYTYATESFIDGAVVPVKRWYGYHTQNIYGKIYFIILIAFQICILQINQLVHRKIIFFSYMEFFLQPINCIFLKQTKEFLMRLNDVCLSYRFVLFNFYAIYNSRGQRFHS